MAKVIAVCGSEKKGMRKKDWGKANFIVEFGMENDGHGQYGTHRQVSLLAMESIKKMQDKGLKVGPGDFAENLTTEGIELFTLPVGTRMHIGSEVIGEVSQIGKECHNHCAIYIQAGDCVMPREGIFIRVLQGGEIKNEDEIVLADITTAAVITVSDKGSCGARIDESGPVLTDILTKAGITVIETAIVPDEKEEISALLERLSTERPVDLILTTGGTGFGPRDVTPEATRKVIKREAPGIGEAMRQASLAKTPNGILSRGIAGINNKTLIINLPGSPKAARENIEAVLPALDHGLKIMRGMTGECARV